MPTLRQLRDLYDEGERPTLHYIESLLEELADQERMLGRRQQQIIDAQHERNARGRTRNSPRTSAAW